MNPALTTESGVSHPDRLPTVAVVTATCGRPELRECVESVAAQSYPRVQHYVFVDGHAHREKVQATLPSSKTRCTVIAIPEATGTRGYNGHRIYGAAPFLVSADYVCFLDDDNAVTSEHVATLVELVCRHDLDWAYSLRAIVDPGGRFVCYDDCDSLGIWGSWYGGQHHIDANCYLLRRDVACEASWIWNRPGYSDRIVDPDKALCRWLLSHKLRGFTSGKYTLQYRLGASAKSVQASYFQEGNAVMSSLYKYFPWRNPILEKIDSETDYRRMVALYEPQRDAILRRLNASVEQRSTLGAFTALPEPVPPADQ